MKKYIWLSAAALFAFLPALRAVDFGDLLIRLDSRDFSAERDVLTGQGGPYIGEQTNPHSETPMFKARDEFYAMMSNALGNDDKCAELSAFILEAVANENVSIETKVWLLHRLGEIGLPADVPAVSAQLIQTEDKESQRLVDAAAAALAKIPGEEARQALEEHQSIPAAAAALVIRNTTPISFDTTETEMPLALSNVSDEEVEAYLTNYSAFDNATKVRVLAGLTARDSKKYRSYALDALTSDDEDLRRTGFLALEKMATSDDIDIILANLRNDSEATIQLASRVVADGFDEALETRLAATDNADDFLMIATILTNRAVDIRPDIFKKTTAVECPGRLRLMQRACDLATVDDVPSLVASTLRIPRGKDHDAAENLVAGVCHGDAAPIIALLDQYPPEAIYPMMCRTGGEAAKIELENALRSSDSKVKAAALRALPDWADATFYQTMKDLLTSSDCPAAMYTPILRAFIRVISLPDDKIGIEMTRDEKLAQLKEAYALAKRPDEKRLILSRLAANRNVNSLKFAMECAADSKVQDAAYEAITAHAHDTALRKEYPELMTEAIQMVIDNSKDADLIKKIEIYKGRME